MTFKCEFEIIKKFCKFVFFFVIFFNFILISKLHANSFKINEIEVSEDFNLDFNRIRQVMIDGYGRAYDIPTAGFTAGPCLLKDTMQLAAFNNNNFFLGRFFF